MLYLVYKMYKLLDDEKRHGSSAFWKGKKESEYKKRGNGAGRHLVLFPSRKCICINKNGEKGLPVKKTSYLCTAKNI